MKECEYKFSINSRSLYSKIQNLKYINIYVFEFDSKCIYKDFFYDTHTHSFLKSKFYFRYRQDIINNIFEITAKQLNGFKNNRHIRNEIIEQVKSFTYSNLSSNFQIFISNITKTKNTNFSKYLLLVQFQQTRIFKMIKSIYSNSSLAVLSLDIVSFDSGGLTNIFFELEIESLNCSLKELENIANSIIESVNIKKESISIISKFEKCLNLKKYS